jgi:hypothetical protein
MQARAESTSSEGEADSAGGKEEVLVFPDYLAAAAAARREELLRSARSRHKARLRGRRAARLWLLLRVKRLSAEPLSPLGRVTPASPDRDGAPPIFGCCCGQMSGGE